MADDQNEDVPYIERVSAVKLTPAQIAKADELARAMNERNRQDGEEQVFTSTMIAIVQGVPEHYSREQVPALVFRLQAFAFLVQSSALAGWATGDPFEAGKYLVSPTVLEAIATAPLIERDDQPAFDVDTFREIALGTADPEGQA